MNGQGIWQRFPGFAVRVIVLHMLTYFIFGILASNVFDYKEIFKQEVIRGYMLPMTERNMWLGPFLQPVRGLVFAIGVWPIRGLLLEKKRGWLILWGLLVTIGIISTPAAAPSSLEGMLFSRIPMWYHLLGLPEICLQTLVFSIWLVWWEQQTVKGAQPEAQQAEFTDFRTYPSDHVCMLRVYGVCSGRTAPRGNHECQRRDHGRGSD